VLAGALPAVLDRMVAAFGLRAALAFQPAGGKDPAVLAVHPPGAADQALLARIGVLSMAQRDSAPGPLAVTLDGRPGSVLMARSVPVAGQCLCALALIGDAAAGDDGYWDAEIRATAHAVAAIVATQIRHANDIATLERSHAELADQTERLNCLISSAIPGVLITDELGTVTNASQSFGIMFGLDGPLAGTRGAAVPLTEEQLSCRDGRTVEWDYWPVLVNGRHRGDIWLAWDMSDRKELERQRVEAQRQLAEQNEGEAEGLTPEGVRFLDIIERNADRLHRLVGDLLMLDRLEAGALPLDLAPVSIPDLAAEAVRSAAPAAAKQGIAIEVSTGDGPLVAADHRRLMQVLDNLIANAVKFSNRNRRVLVAAGYDGQWRIDVTDTGIGIPPEEAGQLFSRFVRASNARTAGLPGTGLGLSIVKVLTEMHGGRVAVDSTLGRAARSACTCRGRDRRGHSEGPRPGDRGRPGHLAGHPDRAEQAGPGGGQLGRREAGPARLPPGPARTLRPGRARHRAAGHGRVGRAGAHPRPERRARAHPDRARPGGRQGQRAPRRCR
jgi:signal transduction histidine kinase